MRYTVQSGTGAYGSFRVILETPEEALRAAQDLMEGGASSVRIIDEAGQTSAVDAFGRELCGHTLTPHQITLIKSTSDVLQKDDAAAADLFYRKLFEIAPQVRPLFADDMAAQKQKLLETLLALVENVMSPKGFAEIVNGLGHRHVGYGAQPEHYGPVGQALLFSLENLLGPRFTPEVKAAWASLYLEIAAAMTAASERRDNAVEPPGENAPGHPPASLSL